MGVKKQLKHYAMDDKEMQAWMWCVRNNICITTREIAWRSKLYRVLIETGRYPSRKLVGQTDDVYNYYDAKRKAAEYTKYYYNKYANKV